MVGRGLSGPTVGDRFKLDFLTFPEGAQIGALDSADMDENILASVFGLNKAEALLRIEEFNCSNRHDYNLS